MATIEERIAKLEAELKQQKAKKAKIEARERAAKAKKSRADDTRKKILVGAVILAKVERGEWPVNRLTDLMEKALTRPDDRALFGLPPIAEESSDFSSEKTTNEAT